MSAAAVPARAQIGASMICPTNAADFDLIYEIINDAAQRYRGVIPADCWHEPYMPRDELRREIEAGVVFWGYRAGSELLGVMGLQPVQDVSLIRHAYVRPSAQGGGIGGALLKFLQVRADRRLLVGTWAAAHWAIRFYERHGFAVIQAPEKDRWLDKYWSIPLRQRDTSVVLADATREPACP
jgi:GNAT superfamily N-acetyltransferase